MKNDLRLISMSEIQIETVQWLWPPYIPLGKLTIVQGDPGEGKTNFALAVISAVTRGDPLPGCGEAAEPVNVIYQTAEDGLADTIKPRLEMVGADCSRVLVIDDSSRELTLSDDRLERAIRETKARLIVLDPLQAYLGSGVDMHRANEVRPVLKRVAAMAERTRCAVILIGHMNKAQGLKSGYRGLGSIDFRAAARSVLLVGRSREDETLRVVVHDKSSLAAEGPAILFSLDSESGFSWGGFCDATASELLSGSGPNVTKTEQAEKLIRDLMADGVFSDYIFTNDSGEPIHPDTFTRHLRRLYDKHGFPKEFHLHTLRHTFATRSLEQGMDVVTLSRLLGHANPSITMDKYGHVLDDHKRASIGKLDGIYSGAKKPAPAKKGQVR